MKTIRDLSKPPGIEGWVETIVVRSSPREVARTVTDTVAIAGVGLADDRLGQRGEPELTGDRVVQVDRKSKTIRDAAGVRHKFGVEPSLIPDYLALVGDPQDGYPGIAGIGAVGAARLLNRYGCLEDFPASVLGDHLEPALLFKRLATLRRDALLFVDVEQLRWQGPTQAFAAWAQRIEAPRLLERCLAAADQ